MEDEKPRSDPFVEDVLRCMPKKVARTLTQQQWEGFREAMNRCLDPRRRLIDLRIPIPLYFYRFYLIFILGRDARGRVNRMLYERRRGANIVASIIAFLFFILVIASLGILAYHLIQYVKGVDVIPKNQ